MLENVHKFEWKTPKFPLTTRGYSMVRIACLDDALLRIIEVEASPVECQLLQRKDKKRRRGKKIKTNEKRNRNFILLRMPEQKMS